MTAAIIRAAAATDADSCADIFAHYAHNTVVNLREEALPTSYFAELINKASDDAPFMVAVDSNDKVLGYAYSDVWRSRCGYEYTTEVSVYVDEKIVGQGVGKQLLGELLAQLQLGKMKTAVSFITMPNDISVKLHEKFGFAAAGVLRGVGYKFNQARDIGIWVKHLR